VLAARALSTALASRGVLTVMLIALTGAIAALALEGCARTATPTIAVENEPTLVYIYTDA